MKPLGVHHVSINVSDPNASVDFYTNVLGGRLRGDRPHFSFGGAWIDFGPSQVHLIENSVPANLGQHFAILYDDLDAVVAKLRERGIAVGDPKRVGTGRQTFVEDPDGNSVELHQQLHVLTEPGASTDRDR
jgi:catechol 2,3-dioxygenase-like lactoylglutathione lyase family enzyme